MARIRFIKPMILSTGMDTGDNPDPGAGSAQGTTDIEPWPWEMWQWMYEEDDSDGNGTPGEYSDYVAWMKKHGFDDYITPEN